MADVADTVGAVASGIGGLGDVTDKELAGMTEAALGLAQTFDMDLTESTLAVGTLMKTGMAKDGMDAFDLLTTAAQKLPRAMVDELPSVVSEYGTFFDQLGFTGPQMMGLFAEAAKDPTFQLDKLADAVKEFTLLIPKTSQVKEPLEELGLSVKHIQKLVNTGHGTKAFDEVVTALSQVEDQTKRTSLQGALFGGPGEDMGNTLLHLKVGGVAAATGMDKAAGSAKKVTDSMKSSPAQSLESVYRTLAGTIGELLGPALKVVSDFLTNNPELVQTLVPIILMLAVALGIAAIAQWAMNSAMLANPMTYVILLIVAIIAIVIVLVTKWDWVKEKLLAAWDYLKAGLKKGWDWMVDHVFSPIGDFFTETIPGWVSTGVDWIVDKWNGLVDFVVGLPGRMWNAAMGMFDGLKAAFKNAVNWLIWKWNNFSITLGGGSILGVDIPSITLSTPNIPYLAEGGVATSPTLAMIGEGGESEAVLPLSKLGAMLSSVAGVRRTESRTDHLVIDVTGADSDMKRMIRKMVRTGGRGDTQIAFGRY